MFQLSVVRRQGIMFDSVYEATCWIVANLGIPEDRSMSIDRIDNEKNYEPGNLRWATAMEQRLNQRKRTQNAKKGHWTELAKEFAAKHQEVRLSIQNTYAASICNTSVMMHKVTMI